MAKKPDNETNYTMHACMRGEGEGGETRRMLNMCFRWLPSCSAVVVLLRIVDVSMLSCIHAIFPLLLYRSD